MVKDESLGSCIKVRIRHLDVVGKLINSLYKGPFLNFLNKGFRDFIFSSKWEKDIDKNKVDLLAGTIASVLLKNISLFEKSGFISFQKKCNEYMYAKDKNVILKSSNEEVPGRLLGINNIGELQIETDEKIVNISDINYSMRLLG